MIFVVGATGKKLASKISHLRAVFFGDFPLGETVFFSANFYYWRYKVKLSLDGKVMERRIFWINNLRSSTFRKKVIRKKGPFFEKTTKSQLFFSSLNNFFPVDFFENLKTYVSNRIQLPTIWYNFHRSSTNIKDFLCRRRPSFWGRRYIVKTVYIGGGALRTSPGIAQKRELC